LALPRTLCAPCCARARGAPVSLALALALRLELDGPHHVAETVHVLHLGKIVGKSFFLITIWLNISFITRNSQRVELFF
jgi:hypothetical protein